MYIGESKLKRSQDYLKPYMGMELYTVQSMRCWYANILYDIRMNIINKTTLVSLVQHTRYIYQCLDKPKQVSTAIYSS